MSPQFDLKGKVAIVTGASSGIGRATAITLARNGAAVVVNYCKNERGAHETASVIHEMRRNALVVRADVTRRAQVAQMVVDTLENFGQIDILVNNAGSFVRLQEFAEFDDDLWDAVMAVNAKSVFLCSQIVLPYLKQQGGGRIINVSTGAVEFGGAGGSLPYAAAKAAVNTLTKGLATELGPHNITVNAVAPGIIATPWHERFPRWEWLQAGIKASPLGRAGTPEEVAELIAFLASDAAAFITGEIFGIDGGR